MTTRLAREARCDETTETAPIATSATTATGGRAAPTNAVRVRVIRDEMQRVDRRAVIRGPVRATPGPVRATRARRRVAPILEARAPNGAAMTIDVPMSVRAHATAHLADVRIAPRRRRDATSATTEIHARERRHDPVTSREFEVRAQAGVTPAPVGETRDQDERRRDVHVN